MNFKIQKEKKVNLSFRPTFVGRSQTSVGAGRIPLFDFIGESRGKCCWRVSACLPQAGRNLYRIFIIDITV
jgi:hypothetical protein